VEGLLHQYGIGELPSHGRTRSVWDLDVNCMYVLLLVHGNHWISMCVNFVTRSIEVFDCAGLKHNKDLEPFSHLIPRIVKAVQSSEKRRFTVKPYDVTYAPMPFLLNKTSSDCGVYALEHIEAHLLGMDLTLVNGDNIREARQKIAYDLWEAANDPELISRMVMFVPPKATTSPTIPGPSDTMGKDSASEIPCPSATMGKSSQSLCPAATKEKGKGKVEESVVPPIVRHSPRQGRKEIETETDDMMDFLKNLSQSSTHGEPSSKKEEMSTQEYLQDAMGNLSQVSHVKDWRTPTLKDIKLPEDRVNDDDYSLVFVPEDSWAKLIHWHLKIGSSMYTTELAERVMGPAVWLQNQRTSLRRWNLSKVAFMRCIFSNQMKNSYIEFKKDRKKFRMEGLLHQYGIGELSSHGRIRSVWDLDVNRMYVPLLVHGNHWISMCVNFVTRSIEVFDCAGLKHNKDLEPFAHLIPRIVKAVQSSEKRRFTVKPNDVTYAPMPFFINKTSSDCGVYALKHIEAHLLGMDLTLVNDDNIRKARQKIAYDLWEAANDPELISRMRMFVPPKATTSPTEIETETDDMMDFLKNLSQSSTHGEPSSKKEEMSTQEYLQDAMGNLSQRTSLRRWNPSKVAFMSCIFSNQMKNAYIEFKKDRKKFRVQGLLHQYGIGELPSHGRTRSVWDLYANCMYVPLLVHGNHWISMCVNFVTHSIEVFDCAGLKHNKDLEPFAHLISRIVKAVQSSEMRGFTVKPYDVTYAQMHFFLNKTSSDCGVYALKHIEAHLLGMDLTLVNDDNISEARQKIAYDLWEAASDPEFILRMGMFVPPKATTSPTVEIL
ncbi:hypothetical protein F2Q69_00031342, partial [Brassica cretica]